jgi:hypothetical protein
VYPGYKRPKTVLFIPSVHMDPRHQPSRHVDLCSPHLLPLHTGPPGGHLLKPSYSLVRVTANSFSLTTLRRPFLAVSRPAQRSLQGLIRFMAHWTCRIMMRILIIGTHVTYGNALTSSLTVSLAQTRTGWVIDQKRTRSSHSCVRMVCPFFTSFTFFLCLFMSAHRTYTHRHTEDRPRGMGV